MTTIDTREPSPKGALLNTAINIISSPNEAFVALKNRPSKLFPLALVLTLNAVAIAWYFNMVDFAWYVDDTLASANLDETQLEAARESMNSISRNSFLGFGVVGSMAAILGLYTLHSSYLSLVSALRGESLKFGHWFSLLCWAGMPALVSMIGMLATIALSANGQLSAYDLDPLTLRNLGFMSENSSIQTLLATVSLTMLWSIGLVVAGYKNWLAASWLRSILTVTAPYLLFLGVWSIFAFS
jgi:hypothetical protein